MYVGLEEQLKSVERDDEKKESLGTEGEKRDDLLFMKGRRERAYTRGGDVRRKPKTPQPNCSSWLQCVGVQASHDKKASCIG
jgi:hypothetical protein